MGDASLADSKETLLQPCARRYASTWSQRWGPEVNTKEDIGREVCAVTAAKALREGVDRAFVQRMNRKIGGFLNEDATEAERQRYYRQVVELGLMVPYEIDGETHYDYTEKGDMYFEVVGFDSLGLDVFLALN